MQNERDIHQFPSISCFLHLDIRVRSTDCVSVDLHDHPPRLYHASVVPAIGHHAACHVPTLAHPCARSEFTIMVTGLVRSSCHGVAE